jgi:hypothetical protein
LHAKKKRGSKNSPRHYLQSASQGSAYRRPLLHRQPQSEEVKKDRAACDAILSRSSESIECPGLKTLLKDRGYARFVKIRKEAVCISTEAVEADSRFDGKFVLQTTPKYLLPTRLRPVRACGGWSVPCANGSRLSKFAHLPSER